MDQINHLRLCYIQEGYMSKSFTLIEVIIILVILSLMVDLSLLLIRMDYGFVFK